MDVIGSLDYSWAALLLGSGLMTGCGGLTDGGPSLGTSNRATGGSNSGVMVSPTGTAGSASGGVAPSTGGAEQVIDLDRLTSESAGQVDSGDGQCGDQSIVWSAVPLYAVGGLAACSYYEQCDYERGPHGVIVVDAEGRIIDITGGPESSKASFLRKVANERCLLYANQNIEYCCNAPR